MPKYTDNRSHYHFKDYSESEDVNHLPCDDNIFIYNQSQNPSSGSRGIACMALALVNNCEKSSTENKCINFERVFETRDFKSTVISDILESSGKIFYSKNTYYTKQLIAFL